MHTPRILMATALLLVFGLLVGCAATSTSTPSAFLHNPPRFEPGPDDGVDQLYTRPGMDLRRYRRVMVDEVQFYLKQGAVEQGIQASELKDLADTFHRAVFEALGNAYPLTGEPGDDVLRIRLALTNIETSNPAVSGLTTVLPVGLAMSVANRTTTESYTGDPGDSPIVDERGDSTQWVGGVGIGYAFW